MEDKPEPLKANKTNWQKWIPEMTIAVEEHREALHRLKRAEDEIRRIAYCLNRDQQLE